MTSRRDTFPEGRLYRDTGCHVQPRCLSCPLPQCIYESTYDPASDEKFRRDTAIVAARDAGTTIPQLCEKFGVSDRTIYRVLQHGPTRPAGLTEEDDRPGRVSGQPIYRKAGLPSLRIA